MNELYEASSAFHQAVANQQEQKALLIFSDCLFTNDDLDVDSGLEFQDHFNMEEDIFIGQALSNELHFSLFNDDRLLNNYKFGEFLATLGVLIGTDSVQKSGNVTMITNRATWTGWSVYPYVRRNGSGVGSQPSFAVRCLLGYDGKVWAFSGTGRYAVYDDQTGANITSSNPVCSFLARKCERWDGVGAFYNKSSRILAVYKLNQRKRYEFVPLGWFIAERPKAPDVIQIDMTCYDFMQKFDIDMPTAQALGVTYPTTIKNLFEKMCAYVKVEYKTSTFINSGATIQKEPEDFKSVTMREVLQWIAEAAGGNAKFDRDGKLMIDWLHQTGQSLTATGYSTFDPYWYETKKITKLHNRASNGAFENIKGSGSEAYLIQDNPLLEGVK